MIIVVEGPNNVGKTTFINNFLLKHPEYKCIHTDGNCPNDKEFYEQMLSSNENIIYDRLHVGEMIYPKLYNRTPRLSVEDYDILCKTHTHVYYIFIDADMQFISQAFKNKNEIMNMCEVLCEKALFEEQYEILCEYGCKVYKIYNTIDNVNFNTDLLINILSHKIKEEKRFVKGYKDDAGVDVLLLNDIKIKAHSYSVIDLNINVTPKINTMSFLVARTSAAIKGIHVASCPIDANYTGTINAIVYNLSDEDVNYKAGEALCQLVTVPIVNPTCNYKIKKRGKRTDGKFGSTNSSK